MDKKRSRIVSDSSDESVPSKKSIKKEKQIKPQPIEDDSTDCDTDAGENKI